MVISRHSVVFCATQISQSWLAGAAALIIGSTVGAYVAACLVHPYKAALERQDLSCAYLAHHELESGMMMIIITCGCSAWHGMSTM